MESGLANDCPMFMTQSFDGQKRLDTVTHEALLPGVTLGALS